MGRLVDVDVHGVARFQRTLRKAGADVAELKAANARAATIVANAAAATAPRRSGRLAASVRGNRAKASAVVRAGGAAVPYAAPVHWGWPRRGIKPQPFLTDAAKATEPVWLAAYVQDLDRIYAQVKGA